ncbi:hypothetical protein AGR4B_Cc80091 [Agrobacterium tumefaciens str. CFBP 5621]|nr:hypothetical protein AGR4B_Cc80091 [Agrobacterium tumefaciens str. CFBP 5621]
MLAFGQDDSAPVNRLLKGQRLITNSASDFGKQVASAHRHPGLDPGSSRRTSVRQESLFSPRT